MDLDMFGTAFGWNMFGTRSFGTRLEHAFDPWNVVRGGLRCWRLPMTLQFSSQDVKLTASTIWPSIFCLYVKRLPMTTFSIVRACVRSFVAKLFVDAKNFDDAQILEKKWFVEIDFVNNR